MTANRVLLLIVPMALMLAAIFGLTGMETGLAGFGRTAAQKLAYARAGMALPYVVAAGIGVIFLFATAGSTNIRSEAWSVVAGCAAAMIIAVVRETTRLSGLPAPARSPLGPIEPSVAVAVSVLLIAGIFAMRVAVKGAPTASRL